MGMTDPVLALDGHSYEREMIRKWFDQQQRTYNPFAYGFGSNFGQSRLHSIPNRKVRSPITNEMIDTTLTANISLRKLIQDFINGGSKSNGSSKSTGSKSNGSSKSKNSKGSSKTKSGSSSTRKKAYATRSRSSSKKKKSSRA